MLSYDFILGNTSATTIFPNKATFRSAGEAGFDWLLEATTAMGLLHDNMDSGATA